MSKPETVQLSLHMNPRNLRLVRGVAIIASAAPQYEEGHYDFTDFETDGNRLYFGLTSWLSPQQVQEIEELGWERVGNTFALPVNDAEPGHPALPFTRLITSLRLLCLLRRAYNAGASDMEEHGPLPGMREQGMINFVKELNFDRLFHEIVK